MVFIGVEWYVSKMYCLASCPFPGSLNRGRRLFGFSFCSGFFSPKSGIDKAEGEPRECSIVWLLRF